MPDCEYCGAHFDDDAALLDHLGDDHADELGPIDRRRVRSNAGEGRSLPTGPLVLAGVVLVALAVIVYVTLFMGGNGPAGGGLGPVGSAHEHGSIEMRIMGERVDFSQPRYQVQADRFHFEERNGRIWHTHARGVTLAWAMRTLDINVTADSVTYRGTTYQDSDPDTEVIVEVNGEPVDPTTYVLDGTSSPQPGGGDQVRIVVRRSNATGTQ